MKKTLGVVLSAMLCACGGGGGDSNPAPVTQPSAPKVATIDAEGGSAMWGFVDDPAADGNVQSHNAPPFVLQATLRAQINPTIVVQNNAAPGTTADLSHSLAGASPYPGTFQSLLAQNTAAQIVLTNAALADSNTTTVDQYTANLVNWIAAVRAAGKTPVLEEPNPVCSTGYPNLAAFRAAMVSVAQSQNVLLIQQYDYILSLPSWKTMMQTDCTYPGDALYQIIGQREAQQLTSLIKSLQ